MALVIVTCLICCLAVFIMRKRIFAYLGMMIYKSMQKSLSSCEGRISAEKKVSEDDVSDNVILFQNRTSPTGFINAKMVGQNFDLNAKENAKYSTPSPYQDLGSGNGLA